MRLDIEITGNKVMQAFIQVGGEEIAVIIDTGCEMTTFNEEALKGITKSTIDNTMLCGYSLVNHDLKFMGYGGSITTGSSIWVDDIVIDGTIIKPLEVAVGSGESLLGMDILSQYKVVISVKNKTVELLDEFDENETDDEFAASTNFT